MEPHTCMQYSLESYDKDRKAHWYKLGEGYREALGLELYYFHCSLFDCTLERHGILASYLHEIDWIIKCLHEAEEIIKVWGKMFYLLNGLPSTWHEWCDLPSVQTRS